MDELSFSSIVHVTEKGGSFGGTEEYISLVTSELGGRGVRSHLVCGTVGSAPPAGLASVDVVDGLASREPVASTASEVVRVLERIDADVIYLHNLFDAAVVDAIAGAARRGPLLWYVHDHYPTCLSELRWRRDVGACHQRLGESCLITIAETRCVLRRPDRIYDLAELDRRRALGRSLGHADGVIVVSEYMRGLVVEAAPSLAGRVHVLPRPIRRPGSGSASQRRRRRAGPRDPAVLTVAGRITPEKGQDVVIEALGAVGTVGTDAPVELCIVGVIEHGPYWDRCRSLVTAATEANPGLSVRHLGHLDYAATDRLLARSDVVAVPSQWPEPFGAVALEAMSAGAAVVASRVGGLDTCIEDGHNGLLVPPADTAAWTAAFTTLLAEPDRATRLARRARAHARTHTAASHLAALDGVVLDGVARRGFTVDSQSICSPSTCCQHRPT